MTNEGPQWHINTCKSTDHTLCTNTEFGAEPNFLQFITWCTL